MKVGVIRSIEPRREQASRMHGSLAQPLLGRVRDTVCFGAEPLPYSWSRREREELERLMRNVPQALEKPATMMGQIINPLNRLIEDAITKHPDYPMFTSAKELAHVYLPIVRAVEVLPPSVRDRLVLLMAVKTPVDRRPVNFSRPDEAHLREQLKYLAAEHEVELVDEPYNFVEEAAAHCVPYVSPETHLAVLLALNELKPDSVASQARLKTPYGKTLKLLTTQPDRAAASRLLLTQFQERYDCPNLPERLNSLWDKYHEPNMRAVRTVIQQAIARLESDPWQEQSASPTRSGRGNLITAGLVGLLSLVTRNMHRLWGRSGGAAAGA
jgi:hypothetical protein